MSRTGFELMVRDMEKVKRLLLGLLVIASLPRSGYAEDFDVRAGGLGSKRPDFFSAEEREASKSASIAPAEVPREKARRLAESRNHASASGTDPAPAEPQPRFSLEYIKEVTNAVSRLADEGSMVPKKKVKSPPDTASSMARKRQAARQARGAARSRRIARGITKPPPQSAERRRPGSCRQSKVYRLPIAAPSVAALLLDTVFFSGTDEAQRKAAARYEGRALPYRSLQEAAAQSDPETLWHAFGELAGLQCLPTRVRFVRADAAGYVEYREGKAAWQ